ncbi:PAS domain-containing sensor histidine kinase [Halopiger aswanensis]|uniref:histidine kinase n=1 Tax=Halopiger aswanensis TaxID=148449 RepID=A0A419W1D1_9EURY|nr:HAMP domain-containing sensor histidine kinase [Halopiger aswanensis]RKD89070.1 PAS domain S-box-containing protein [Halopiger aswanensis]
MPDSITSKLSTEYENLHIGIALYDPESGTILDANERLESLFGYATAELRELSIETYSANTYSLSEADFIDRLRTSAAGSSHQFSWRVKRADGELIWVQIQLSQTSDDDEYVLAEIRDVTEDYNTGHREELFWRILRHNLRNKANTLMGYSEFVTVNAETDELSDAAEKIESCATELGTLTESIKQIQYAVEQADSQRITRDATTAVREIIDEVTATYPSAEISLEEREQMWVTVDEGFRYALTQALENAIVHSETEAPVVTVVIGPSPNTGRVEIRIQDRNPLISETEIESIYTRNEVTNTSHGSGVGLFVMKWCIESLGGELTFERRAPRGNTVYFYLPPQESPHRSS